MICNHPLRDLFQDMCCPFASPYTFAPTHFHFGLNPGTPTSGHANIWALKIEFERIDPRSRIPNYFLYTLFCLHIFCYTLSHFPPWTTQPSIFLPISLLSHTFVATHLLSYTFLPYSCPPLLSLHLFRLKLLYLHRDIRYSTLSSHRNGGPNFSDFNEKCLQWSGRGPVSWVTGD